MEYDLKFSSKKGITLKVRDARLFITAPYGTKIEDIEKIVNKHKRWINNRITSQKNRLSIFSSLDESDIKQLKKDARIYFLMKTAYYAKMMNAVYNKVTITSAKTRFGSCTSSGNISYSFRLMLFPEEAREYIVVHELAHTFEMNHSANFYKIIESIMPDYKERNKLLK